MDDPHEVVNVVQRRGLGAAQATLTVLPREYVGLLLNGPVDRVNDRYYQGLD